MSGSDSEVDIGPIFRVPPRLADPDDREDTDRILDDVNKIRRGLRKVVEATETERRLYDWPFPTADKLVRMDCFHRSEALKIESFLTDWERDHTVFTWCHDL